MPTHVIAGPPEHGVTEYALELQKHIGGPFVRAASLDDLPESVDGDLIQVCFTDHLFGSSPDEAVQRVLQLADGHRLSVSFHDVPQQAEGVERFARRADAYRELASRADITVVNSQHEAAFFADTPTTVIPLPLTPSAARVPALAGPDVAIMGFVYPGKGHEELLRSLAGTGRRVTALGRLADGRDWLASRLADTARESDIDFEITGYLSSADLEALMLATHVPVCAHRHFSASGSLMKWLSLGRRVLVADSPYARELSQRWPGFITLVGDDQWAQALSDLPADYSAPLPAPTDWTWGHVARAYEEAWS